MFSGLNKFLKYILPKRLFYRALIIVAAPTIILQIIITVVFYDSVWIKANKNINAMIIKRIDGSVVHNKNNLTDEAEIISFGTKKSKTSFCDLIFISTAFGNFEVLNQ